MTRVLGGEASGAFNAPARVRASGRGRRPCARRLPVRVSLFPYSTAANARPLIDSLDAISVFEVVDVEGCVYTWPVLLCASVRVPLIDTLDKLCLDEGELIILLALP